MFESLPLYADALLFMTSLGALLYCMQLQARLKGLQRLDKGVAKSIQELSKATAQSMQASDEIREQIKTAIEELDERHGLLKSRRQEVEDLLDTVDGQIGLQVKKCHEARQLTERALTPLVYKAEVEIQALTRALEVSSRLAGIQSSLQVDDDIARAAAEVAQAPDGEHGLNPFLRAVGE
ncbi:MAG: hypothetical protein AAF511_04605 [Pseudomonadota bacterium]